MLISNEEALKRINSPLNLINGLKRPENKTARSAMGLFIPAASQRPSNQDNSTSTLPFKFENPFEKPLVENQDAGKKDALIPIPAAEDKESVNQLVTEADAQIKLALAHNNALDLLTNAVAALSTKLDNVKAEKLPAVITAAGKVVESIRKERLERDKVGKDKEVHYHFYTPQQRRVSDYEVIDIVP